MVCTCVTCEAFCRTQEQFWPDVVLYATDKVTFSPEICGFLCCLMESHCQGHYMAMPIGSQTLDFLIINVYTPLYHHVKELIVLNFFVTVPYAWNCLPVYIRTICQLSALKCQLKSHLFQTAFVI